MSQAFDEYFRVVTLALRVGWVERSDTHRQFRLMMGIALFCTSYNYCTNDSESTYVEIGRRQTLILYCCRQLLLDVRPAVLLDENQPGRARLRRAHGMNGEASLHKEMEVKSAEFVKQGAAAYYKARTVAGHEPVGAGPYVVQSRHMDRSINNSIDTHSGKYGCKVSISSEEIQ